VHSAISRHAYIFWTMYMKSVRYCYGRKRGHTCNTTMQYIHTAVRFILRLPTGWLFLSVSENCLCFEVWKSVLKLNFCLESEPHESQ
jgi:hypothetical protein